MTSNTNNTFNIPTYDYRFRWIALLVLMLGYILSVFHRLVVAIIADKLLVDLNLGTVQLGILTAIFFYPYAFMQFPIGVLSDRYGTRRIVSIMLFVACLSSIMFGLSNSFYIAAFSRFMIGFAVSSVFVPSQKFMSDYFPPYAFATLASYFFASGMIGALGATVPLAYMINQFGWRSTFIALGILTGLLAIVVWIAVPEMPRKAAKIRRDTDECQIVEQTRDSSSLPWHHAVKRVLLEPKLRPIAIRNFFNYGSNMTFQGLWAGPFLMMIIGLNRETVGYLLMLFPIGQFIMSLVAGYLSSKVFRSRKIPAVISAYLSVLFWVPFAFFPEFLTVNYIGLLFLLNGLLGGLQAGPGLAQIKELFPNNLTGTAMGLGNLFTISGPAVLPVIISLVMSNHALVGGQMTIDTYEVSFRYLLGAAVIAAIAISFSKDTLAKTLKDRVP